MLKKTIKFKDLEGNDAEVDAYFNLTKAEALELNIRNDLEVIGRGRNTNEIMDAFKKVMQMSYGVRTGDGRFIKVNNQGAPLFFEFASTEAYSELFMELFSNVDYAIEFIKAVLPADLVAAMPDESQSNIPANLASHPSMQGHKQPETRREARDVSQTSNLPGETLEEMEARIRNKVRAEMEAEERSRNASPQTPPAQVSLTPEEAQTPDVPNRDQLI